MTKGSAFKIAMIALLGLIILWLAKSIFFPTNYGMGVNVTGYYGGGNMYMNNTFGFGAGTISLLLVFLIKFFLVIFVVGLLIGLFVTAKTYIFTTDDIETIKGTFTGTNSAKTVCSICGKKLASEWKTCPYCGKEIENISKE